MHQLFLHRTATIRVRVKTEVDMLYTRYDVGEDYYRGDENLLTVLISASLIDSFSLTRLLRDGSNGSVQHLILGLSDSSRLQDIAAENVVAIKSGATIGIPWYYYNSHVDDGKKSAGHQVFLCYVAPRGDKGSLNSLESPFDSFSTSFFDLKTDIGTQNRILQAAEFLILQLSLLQIQKDDGPTHQNILQ